MPVIRWHIFWIWYWEEGERKECPVKNEYIMKYLKNIMTKKSSSSNMEIYRKKLLWDGVL